MSSNVDAEYAYQNFIYICCSVSSTSLIVFEYLITFDREYELVWKRRFSAATLVFLFARYIVLLENIFYFITGYPLTNKGCSAMGWSIVIFELLKPLLWAAFSSLRAYVLSGRRWKAASLIFALSLIPFGLDLFTYVQTVPVEAPPPVDCQAVSSSMITPEVNEMFNFVARSATIISDILVLAVTVSQTYYIMRLIREADIQTSLQYLLLRDGTLYFVMLLLMNVASIISSATQTFLAVDTCFIDPMTAILTARFVFNLRKLESPGSSSSDAPSVLSQDLSVRFAAFVDPLGAPLDHEFSSSALDISHSVEEGQADDDDDPRLSGAAPDNTNENMWSAEMSEHRSSEAEAGSSGVRTNSRSAVSTCAVASSSMHNADVSSA